LPFSPAGSCRRVLRRVAAEIACDSDSGGSQPSEPIASVHTRNGELLVTIVFILDALPRSLRLTPRTATWNRYRPENWPLGGRPCRFTCQEGLHKFGTVCQRFCSSLRKSSSARVAVIFDTRPTPLLEYDVKAVVGFDLDCGRTYLLRPRNLTSRARSCTTSIGNFAGHGPEREVACIPKGSGHIMASKSRVSSSKFWLNRRVASSVALATRRRPTP
jgi:hypothetical protein